MILEYNKDSYINFEKEIENKQVIKYKKAQTGLKTYIAVEISTTTTKNYSK